MFEVNDRLRKMRFFKNIFLAYDINNHIVLNMFWLKMIDPNVHWKAESEKFNVLKWKEYSTNNVLTIQQKIAIFDAENWAEKALEFDNNIYVMHVKYLPDKSIKYFAEKKTDNINGNFLSVKYTDFLNVFSKKRAKILVSHEPQNHFISLIKKFIFSHCFIYNLSKIELILLRKYIDKYLVNGFIRPSKSPADASILFAKKFSKNLRFCVHYRNLNNIIIKN